MPLCRSSKRWPPACRSRARTWATCASMLAEANVPFVDRLDDAALAASLERLLADAALRQRIGMANCGKACRDFDQTRMFRCLRRAAAWRERGRAWSDRRAPPSQRRLCRRIDAARDRAGPCDRRAVRSPGGLAAGTGCGDATIAPGITRPAGEGGSALRHPRVPIASAGGLSEFYTGRPARCGIRAVRTAPRLPGWIGSGREIAAASSDAIGVFCLRPCWTPGRRGGAASSGVLVQYQT